MPTYKYKCEGCGKDYLEHRSVDEPQTYDKCDICGATYKTVE